MQINLVKPTILSFSKDTPLSYFKERLKASGAKQVDFFTMNGANIPICERVADLQSYPILLQIDGGSRIFALNFSQEFKITQRVEHAIKDQEYYSDFAQGVGVKGYQMRFLPFFAHRFQKALPTKQDLTKQEIQSGLNTVTKYMAGNRPFYGSHGDQPSILNLGHALSDLEAKQKQWSATQTQVAKLEVRARRKAFLMCMTGASVGIAQLGLIAFGTFEYYSWDIMEPVCYLMTFWNFSFGYLFYLYQKRELEMNNIYDILTRRFLEKSCARKGIDYAAHDKLKQDIEALQTQLKLLHV